MVGYDDQSKAHRCYDPANRKIYISRNVTFNESNNQQFPHVITDKIMDTQFFDKIS